MNVDINGYSVKYLRNNEKKLLEKILNIQGASLEEMRIMYIKRLSIFNEVSDMDSDTIITKILDVVKESNASIFELRKLFNFKEVYELDNKIIKFNTSFNIPSDRNILQPISNVKLTSGKALTIFKKLSTEGVYEIENITQIMYNRLRDDGLIWLDVHRENIGILDSELDENDDGFKHAAVVYKIPEAGEVYIADPVTDVRVLSEVSRQEKNAIIKDILLKKNWMRTPREYVKDYGIITAYDENIRDKEEIEAIPTVNKTIEKK